MDIEILNSLNSLNTEELKEVLLQLNSEQLLAVKETAKEIKSQTSLANERKKIELDKAMELLAKSNIDLSLLNIKAKGGASGGATAHNNTVITVSFNDSTSLKYDNKTLFCQEFFSDEIETFEQSLNSEKLQKQRNTRFYNRFTSDKAIRKNLLKLDMEKFGIKQVTLTVNGKETVYK